MIPYPLASTGTSKYTHWLCGTDVYTTETLQESQSIVGTCRAGSNYAWGFSFLLTFVTSVLTLVFTLMMYGLWYYVHRQKESSVDVGELKDAVTMVTLAQQQYGSKIGEWSSDTLQREVFAGRTGMSYTEKVSMRRKRKVPSREEQEYGDPRAGDWGGDVYVTDSR
jgi:hypothetical protein